MGKRVIDYYKWLHVPSPGWSIQKRKDFLELIMLFTGPMYQDTFNAQVHSFKNTYRGAEMKRVRDPETPWFTVDKYLQWKLQKIKATCRAANKSESR